MGRVNRAEWRESAVIMYGRSVVTRRQLAEDARRRSEASLSVPPDQVLPVRSQRTIRFDRTSLRCSWPPKSGKWRQFFHCLITLEGAPPTKAVVALLPAVWWLALPPSDQGTRSPRNTHYIVWRIKHRVSLG